MKNAFIFGLSSDEVINYENNGGYNPQEIYFNDWDIKRVVDQLMDGTYSHGDHEMFRDLYNSLLNTQGGDRPDRYFNPERLPLLCRSTEESGRSLQRSGSLG